MTRIDIRLEPNSTGSLVYYPGELLRGTVELSLDHVKSFRAFYVTVFGKARAHWTETRTRTTGTGKNRRTTTYTVHFEGKEVYLNSKTYLFGQSGGPSFDMQPGIHKYSFACQLPLELPYTLDATHGEIKYHVEAVLDIPWRFDKEIKTPFTIVRHDDLNLYPELKIAQKFEEYKTFCCLFCESGPLLMHVTVPYTGFAKGQSIPLKIEYSNKSDVDIISTKVKLKRGIYFISQTPHEKVKSEKEKMVEISARGVKGGESLEMEVKLDIPVIMLCSNGRFCNVIKIEYHVEVEGEVDGCHTNPELSFPITIGSVPLVFNNQLNNTSIAPASIQMPTAPIIQPIQPSAPVEDQRMDDLPPSFEDAIKMDKPEISLLMKQSESSNLGWNVSVPSAPAGNSS